MMRWKHFFVNAEGGGNGKTTLTGVEIGVDVTASEKVWSVFQAIGDIAFAYAFSNVLIEIQASNIFMYFLIIQYLSLCIAV